MSIVQALIEQVDDIASREGPASVVRITIAVGSLSGVDPEALRLAFPIAAEGTRSDGAALQIDTVLASVNCRECGKTSSPEFPVIVCAHCCSPQVELVSGRELTLTAIELDVPDPARDESGALTTNQQG